MIESGPGWGYPSAISARRRKPGDVILSIDGSTVQRFEDIQQIVRLNPDVAMTIVVRRDGQERTLHITPSRTELTDRFGNHYQIGLGCRPVPTHFPPTFRYGAYFIGPSPTRPSSRRHWFGWARVPLLILAE
jgi:membrane-associated protease RseP (regulator of RpoE activity)